MGMELQAMAVRKAEGSPEVKTGPQAGSTRLA